MPALFRQFSKSDLANRLLLFFDVVDTKQSRRLTVALQQFGDYPLASTKIDLFLTYKSLFRFWILGSMRQILFHASLKFSPYCPHMAANFASPEIKFALLRLRPKT
jgi:hypothetical protein